ncbi:D123-domain-containing protein [Sporormia fimetaria CBS 119925]|uniref:D123-domain-containing protein n=1 Tax=Sporormia fimetaria CBS 119925 TaxID=1340428 RepID=A0A6A6V4R3_9PLEO|nr:D123-domain-containing protein [Sporormia fimetaria CBS 119925]
MADPETYTKLPFPPVTKQHILNCSYHNWHPRYRTITPKARLVPLPQAFLDYLCADGIVLPPEDDDRAEWSDTDSGIFSGVEGEQDEDEADDPSVNWRDTHAAIEDVIEELGGKVTPKLNWSAPKDATWIAPTNTMECRSPSDIYMLLKASDFIMHDVEHAFDDTEEVKDEEVPRIPYYLVLRKWFELNPSVEFRCFVRNRKLIALCQRDLNHFEFLFKQQDQLRNAIQQFFDKHLKDSFPDPNFAFDVYVQPPHDRVWLIDINPWSVRTDPLVFSWLELLTLPEPVDPVDDGDDEVEEVFVPEFRLIRKDDPEAYNFSTQQYSAHKMPKDVVDASRNGGAELREFTEQWKEAQRLAEQQQAEDSEDTE